MFYKSYDCADPPLGVVEKVELLMASSSSLEVLQEEEEVEERKGLSNGERSCGSTLSLFFDGRKQYEKRARIRTRATPMAEYQIEDTSYKSRWLLPR